MTRTEGSPSGLWRRLGKAVYSQGYRGFKSLSLRQEETAHLYGWAVCFLRRKGFETVVLRSKTGFSEVNDRKESEPKAHFLFAVSGRGKADIPLPPP